MRNISRLRVTSIHGYQLIDVCPINLLRAFDIGMIGVDADYRVVVSRYIHEDEKQAYGLKQLAGTRLYLLMGDEHLPKIEGFLWHLGERFEK